MKIGVGVARIVGLVDDQQVEARWSVQACKSLRTRTLLAGEAVDEIAVDERKRKDGAAVPVGPLAVQVRLVEAVPHLRTGQRDELPVEPAHLAVPLLLHCQRL